MKDIPHSLAGFIRFLNLKSLRARTLESYLSWVTRIARHHGVACASLLNQEQVLTFLHYVQQTKGYEGSTLNQCVCALRTFYRDHLERSDWTCWNKIKIKRSEPLPTVLAREEVRTLLASVKEPRFRALFSLMYHCGLRLGEACRLEVTHLDRKRGVLRVINGSRGPREGPRQTARNEQPCSAAEGGLSREAAQASTAARAGRSPWRLRCFCGSGAGG